MLGGFTSFTPQAHHDAGRWIAMNNSLWLLRHTYCVQGAGGILVEWALGPACNPAATGSCCCCTHTTAYLHCSQWCWAHSGSFTSLVFWTSFTLCVLNSYWCKRHEEILNSLEPISLIRWLSLQYLTNSGWLCYWAQMKKEYLSGWNLQNLALRF